MLNAAVIEDFSKEHNVSDGDLLKVLKMLEMGNMEEYVKHTHMPVGVEEFVESKQFLGKKGILYPVVMDSLIEMNSGDYTETLLTGGIGAAKTTLALYTTAYQLYLLSTYKYPHKEFGLDPSSEILIIFQSITGALAKDVDYARFKDMIAQSHYFQRNFMFNKYILSELQFPNRIIVKPVSGSELGAIGQNVIGGVIDELNFMAIVEKSKSSIDGGTYNQAVSNYDSISARRKSRFVDLGSTPGILCLVSSKRYPGQFTDTKEDEVKADIERDGFSPIYVYEKRVWDVKPWEFEEMDWFPVFTGDETHEPKILEDHDMEKFQDNPNVQYIPEIYRVDFEKDMIRALRDIAGVSTLARSPYMQLVSRVTEAFDQSRTSILTRTLTDFTEKKIKILTDRIENKEKRRWCHVDLSLTGDSAGMSMGYVEKFKEFKVSDGISEMMPLINFDFTLEIRPPKGKEIVFAKIRSLVYKLRQLGMNIVWVSFDGYQSADSMQQLRAQGFKTGYISLDKDTIAYETFKHALYMGRVRTHPHKKLRQELVGLNIDATGNQNKGKIDHPPKGSKDISDSGAAVVHGLTTRKEIWIEAGIPLVQIPERIRKQTVKVKEGEAG